VPQAKPPCASASSHSAVRSIASACACGRKRLNPFGVTGSDAGDRRIAREREVEHADECIPERSSADGEANKVWHCH
jgi:hypothetical protein